MKFLKSHFALSRSQQNGIFVLVIIIILMQILLFAIDWGNDDAITASDDEGIMKLRKELDSLNHLKQKKRSIDTIYPFNPNFLTDFKAYQLGLSPQEIDRILEHRRQNKWVNSAEEFKLVSGVSDSLLQKLAPYFRFPEWTQRSGKTPVYKNRDVPEYEKDLNKANAEDFAKLKGIGAVLSNRIVSYREKIGGFRGEIQLSDVYGLTPELISELQRHFKIFQDAPNKLPGINSISQAELAEIPYFSEMMAKKIITYRNLHQGISSFEELSEIDGFPSDKISKIKLYLGID